MWTRGVCPTICFLPPQITRLYNQTRLAGSSAITQVQDECCWHTRCLSSVPRDDRGRVDLPWSLLPAESCS